MKCRQAERRMLLGHDGRLSPAGQADLDLHLRSCHACRARSNDYRLLFETLAAPDAPPLRENFWQRLEARIVEREEENGWAQVLRWCRRAVPAALTITALILAAILAFSPAVRDDYSPSEALLLRDDPLPETRTLLEDSGLENKNMMLIFASTEEYALTR